MKKVFTLPQGLDKFSADQIKNISAITGGIVPDPPIHIPTGAGGRRCPRGMVWSESLQECVTRIAIEDVGRRVL